MASTNALLRGTLALGFCLAPLGVLGCGARGVVAGDAGGDATADAPPQGLRAFDVVVALAAPGDAGVTNLQLPPTNRFTLVLDAAGHQIIVGGNGTGSVVPVTTADGKTFRASTAFDTATPPQGTCAEADRIHFTTLELTLAGTTLTGHAAGTVDISCGDCTFADPFEAELSGGADATPPTLVSGARRADPFDDFTLLTSEPLPLGATARVVGSEGFGVELEPVINKGDAAGAPAVVVGFSKANIVLGAGGGYAVELGGLADFAGLRGSTTASLRLGSFSPPPLVPGDGFESATGATLGGAAIVKVGTDVALAPLAGTQSVYLGASAAPLVAKLGAGSRFMVRLAVPAGATKVVFTARDVAPRQRSGFAGSLAVGSVGKTPAVQVAFELPTTETVTKLADGSTVVLSDVKTREVPLPADVTDEVVVEITANDFACGPTELPSGLLVDDLRVE